MGVGVAMARHAEIAHAEGKPALADRQVMHQRHEMHGRIGVVGPGGLVDGDGHRNAAPLAHQAGSGGNFVRRDVVESAEFVVLAPPAPIFQLLEHRVEGGQRNRGRHGQCSGHLRAPRNQIQADGRQDKGDDGRMPEAGRPQTAACRPPAPNFPTSIGQRASRPHGLV